MADSVTQTITVNGQEVAGKQVTALSFDGDNATLTYSDNSIETAAIEQVRILFSYDTDPTSIQQVSVFEFGGIVSGQLQLGGLENGTPIQIVDITGKTWISTKATDRQASIDVGLLRHGIYVVKAGNQIVKFMKK